MSPVLLSAGDLAAIHGRAIERYGGLDGVRDLASLELAAARPAERFGARLVHESPFHMAAALIVAILTLNPFVDGNARTGLLAGLVLLDLNGIGVAPEPGPLGRIVEEVPAGRMGLEQVAAELRALSGG